MFSVDGSKPCCIRKTKHRMCNGFLYLGAVGVSLYMYKALQRESIKYTHRARCVKGLKIFHSIFVNAKPHKVEVMQIRHARMSSFKNRELYLNVI